MVNTATTVRRRLAPAQPASFVAFDVLAVADVDVRPMGWSVRRQRVEYLGKRWAPPLQVSPVTADVGEAREWLGAFKSCGVERLVVKGASTRYQPGRRDWVKVNSAGVRGCPIARACVVGLVRALSPGDLCGRQVSGTGFAVCPGALFKGDGGEPEVG